MWKFLKYSILGLFIAMAVQSCDNNPCKQIECKNNGTCREGACACPSGYEGIYCENKASDKFIGYWDGIRRRNGSKDSNLTLIIAPGDNQKEIKLYGLYSLNFPFKADVSLTNLSIPFQFVGGKVGFRGNGYVEKDKYIKLYYEELDSLGTIRNCIFEGTKFIKP
jgi:hypothetical protein